jgi:phenylalanyl-tRNA synthetase beta chain
MPTVAVERDALFQILEKTYTEEEFDQLCFDIGVELDEVTSEQQMARKEKGAEAATGEKEIILYKIDVPANRYDLLCLEGISRAFRVFLGMDPVPVYKCVEPKSRLVMNVEASTNQIRPFVVSAVLRGLTLDHLSYNSFLDLQDKLHFNICRRRSLVAIGTHDLDTLTPPFRYRAMAPKDIKFVPLMQEKEYTADKLMEYYLNDPAGKNLKPYVPLIYDSPVYPVIMDAKDTVCSLPPIINGSHSKISPETKNCLIECTATDLTKAEIVLNTIVCMFSQYCKDKFTVEPVDVVYEKDQGAGKKWEIDLTDRDAEAKVADVWSVIGITNKELTPEAMCTSCNKLQLTSTYDKASEMLRVKVPPTRTDILHPIDVIEDIAIAFGFDNIPKQMPSTNTVGKQQPVNQLADLLRDELARAGYLECLSLGLASMNENYHWLNRPDDKLAVVLSNPMTIEFEIVRTTLLPGILKTLRENKSMPMKDGVKLFEVSDIVLLDKTHPVGCRNHRRLCALYTGPTAGFEIIHGLVDRLMQLLEINLPESDKLPKYKITPSSEMTYFPGRSADLIIVDEKGETKIGSFGVLHPECLKNFEIVYPCSIVEIEIECFL